MKTSLNIILFLLFTQFMAMGQGQDLPDLMIMPTDLWFNQNDYTITIDNEGTQRMYPDYVKACQNNDELEEVTTTIQSYFQERGYNTQTLLGSINEIDEELAQMNIKQSKATGDGVRQTPEDLLNQTVSSDILLKISWKIEKKGPFLYLNSFTMNAIDTYSKKAFASEIFAGGTKAQNTAMLITEAVNQTVTNLLGKIQDHFSDIKSNGREIEVKFFVWDGTDFDFDNECGSAGDKYRYVIDDWLLNNTVNEVYELDKNTGSQLSYKDVRIPYEKERNGRMRKFRLLDFGRSIEGFLEQQCALKGQVNFYEKGIGEIWVYLGE
ncbi:hypothetical protein FNH22_30740 [Fulvivirga sp. M361]|uniref:DUF6175 family protein n=1 Tax=Fulvivirga sp. M361 TaxID=2594266 RepID=UPI00117ADEBA|nr:DUF6175 family protein [Fulvivirga sp. M361]TRX46488.1 hypothetical protein FNH22_30740 [Fulvivirga sp. M361]